MNRTKKIEKLMNEGFTVETLVSFSDSNINALYSRIVENEEKNVKLNSDTPDIKNVIDNLQKQGVEDIEISEENEKPIVDKKKNRKLAVTTEQLKMIVKNMVNEKYSILTTKEEINEKINSVIDVDNKKKKKIPEFMTYDAIKNNTAPAIAPTKPKTAPTIKPKTPYSPGPGKNPKPKALTKGLGK